MGGTRSRCDGKREISIGAPDKSIDRTEFERSTEACAGPLGDRVAALSAGKRYAGTVQNSFRDILSVLHTSRDSRAVIGRAGYMQAGK